MTNDFNARMRVQLMELRDELEALASTADASADVVELDQTRMGRLSRMDALQAQAMAQEAGRRRAATLRGIASALARIDSGEYGVCQSCDESIPRRRLEFDPAALMCVQCASKAEQS